ncbi:MAG: hypothetical protein R3Y16_06795 [Rikenellaceae bacterium]
MKKILFLMLAAVTLLASCQKSELDGVSDGGVVDVTLSASMSGASATTRSGEGTTVDRCILEVYTGGTLYKRMVTSVEELTASFNLRLVSSQNYDFLLWADKSLDETTVSDDGEVTDGGDKYYDTDSEYGLTAITADYTAYAGNDEARDAFYCAKNMTIEASTVIEADLTRPFGQVNVKTYLEDVPESMYPASAKIVYTTTVGDTFNVLDGSISGSEIIEWSAAAAVMDGTTGLGEDVKYIDLTTDYLFASEKEQDLHNFTMYFYSNEDGTEYITENSNFKSIPVQRNYKTNISGELLTKQGTISVTVTPAFEYDEYEGDSDINVTIKEVATLDEANDIISSAEEDINVKVVGTVSGDGNTVGLPDVIEESGVNSVTIDFSSIDNTTEITIGSDSETYDGTVNIIVSSEEQAKSITVNAGDAHVTFYGTAGNVITLTSDTTFIVEAGASIETLTVNGGNVEIYGEVADVIFADNNDDSIVKVWTVYDETQFDKALALEDRIEKIVLGAELEFTSAKTLSSITIDGGDQLLTMSGDNHFIVKDSVTMNNMNIASTTTIYKGTIYVEDADSTLEINNSTINYNTSGTTTVFYNGAIVVNPAADIDNVNVTINSSTINLNGTYQTGVSFMATAQQYDSSLTLDDTLIYATTDDPNNASYTTGLSLGMIDGFKFDMKNGSEIRNVYYGYYGYEDYHPTNIDIDITDSEISGYGIMFRGIGGTFDIKNSTIIGRNYYSTYSDFGTIVFTYDGNINSATAAAQNITMTIDNSTIKSYRSSDCDQWLIDVRSSANTGNAINIINGSKFIDEVADDDDYMTYLIELDPADTKVTTDGTEVLEGGNEVRLVKAITLVGSGTKDDPYQISKGYEMTGISTISGYYELMNDIDLTGYVWENLNVAADGVFDGKNYTFKNFTFGPDYGHYYSTMGIFGAVYGTVKNLKVENLSYTIEDSYASWTYSCGGIAGYCGGLIENCSVSGDIKAKNTNVVYVGGIVGKLGGGTIDGCTFSGNITKHSNQTFDTYAGGIAGWLSINGSTITNCVFSGSVEGTYADGICAGKYSYTLTESNNDVTQGTVIVN